MAFNIPRSRFAFEALPDYFVYTNPNVSNDAFPAIVPNFGLEEGMTWKRLRDDLASLNAQSALTGAQYKLVFVARHGEGVHNVAEAKYGTKAWDEHWSLLTGDGQSTWGPDPPLTEVGEGQAHDACQKWRTLLQIDDPVPLPTMFFSSPMVRSARTLQLTFDGLVWPAEHAKTDSQLTTTEVRPRILECLREDFRDRHTCDQRSKRSAIAARWEPLGWTVDKGMDEEDTIFASDVKETAESMAERLADALSLVWQLSEGHSVISITAHSGAMQALFRALHHDDFKPKTGGMVPLFVKATQC